MFPSRQVGGASRAGAQSGYPERLYLAPSALADTPGLPHLLEAPIPVTILADESVRLVLEAASDEVVDWLELDPAWPHVGFAALPGAAADVP